MNVAILGAGQTSQVVAEIIEEDYNPWLKSRLAEPITVAAYAVGGGLVDKMPALGDKPLLNFGQFAVLYRQKLIDKIIFP